MTALCPVSGKHRYPDWDTAVGQALRCSRRCGLPLRVYLCPDCGGHHLTRRATWTERRAA